MRSVIRLSHLLLFNGVLPVIVWAVDRFFFGQIQSPESNWDTQRSCRVENAMILLVSTYSGTHWLAYGTVQVQAYAKQILRRLWPYQFLANF